MQFEKLKQKDANALNNIILNCCLIRKCCTQKCVNIFNGKEKKENISSKTEFRLNLTSINLNKCYKSFSTRQSTTSRIEGHRELVTFVQ